MAAEVEFCQGHGHDAFKHMETNTNVMRECLEAMKRNEPFRDSRGSSSRPEIEEAVETHAETSQCILAEKEPSRGRRAAEENSKYHRVCHAFTCLLYTSPSPRD